MALDCQKCNGKGTVPRDKTFSVTIDGTTVTVPNPEADVHQHPILSQSEITCPSCGGGGKVPVKTERQRAVEAQKSATG
jgi:RecJ-like exonuclease